MNVYVYVYVYVHAYLHVYVYVYIYNINRLDTHLLLMRTFIIAVHVIGHANIDSCTYFRVKKLPGDDENDRMKPNMRPVHKCVQEVPTLCVHGFQSGVLASRDSAGMT